MGIVRDLSVVLLAAEAFVLALVPLVLFGGLVYGMWWLQRHENLPSWLALARAYLEVGRATVALAMAVVVRPFMLIYSVVGTVQGWLSVVARVGGKR